ncbi:hypothetical protein CPT_Muldoon_028 [Serratia phage Muldoon]|uniref:Uncharacterized protein n=1 Tax=Serratia phage Muldoon TaxID=2601678 RepID=A0A5P8PH55_9CAUD|nr:hypothetical protein HYP94_gp028 [Serratia phage Muldoon]QFR55985.1 hypothetical protein CPT_Muldoon_028 [Serratia phage Muldoon]
MMQNTSKHKIEDLKFCKSRHKEALERSKVSWAKDLPECKSRIAYHEQAIAKITSMIEELEHAQ